MGEWFIEQKAKRSKLSQSAALTAIKGGGLFDRKVEKRSVVFHAAEAQGAPALPDKSLLVIQCRAEGPATLLRGLERIGDFNARESERVREFMRERAQYGGVLPVRLERRSPLDGGLDVVPEV